MKPFGRFVLLTLALVALVGCQRSAPPVGTGARDAVTRYFDALIKDDWNTAYAQLHPDTCKQFDAASFQRRAQSYRKQLGFPLGKFHIRSCDEQGDAAIAQVILQDAAGSAKNRFHEGVVLHKAGDFWRIKLTDQFGQPRR